MASNGPGCERERFGGGGIARGVVERTQQSEGVGFDPVDLAAFGEVRIEREVAFGGFERGARLIDAGDLRADLRRCSAKPPW